MNEPLFYNRFAHSKEMAKENANYWFFKTKLMKLAYFCFFVISLPIIIFAPHFIKILDFIPEIFNIFVLLLRIFWIITLIYLPLSYFLIIKVQTPKTPDDAMSVVSVTETEIQCKIGKKTISLNPHKTHFFYESENYIVVSTGMTSIVDIILKKDSFSIGTSEEFVNFLKKNGAIQIK